jgi:hypothetical protein
MHWCGTLFSILLAFWSSLLLLLSRIKKYNVCCLPSHTPTTQLFCVALPRASPATYGAAAMRARTYQSGSIPQLRHPYRSNSNHTNGFSPSSLFVSFEREAPPPHRGQPTNQPTNRLNQSTTNRPSTHRNPDPPKPPNAIAASFPTPREVLRLLSLTAFTFYPLLE